MVISHSDMAIPIMICHKTSSHPPSSFRTWWFPKFIDPQRAHSSQTTFQSARPCWSKLGGLLAEACSSAQPQVGHLIPVAAMLQMSSLVLSGKAYFLFLIGTWPTSGRALHFSNWWKEHFECSFVWDGKNAHLSIAGWQS